MILHRAYALAVVVTVTALLAFDGPAESFVMLISGLAPAAAIGWHLRRRRPGGPLPWHLALVGLGLLTGTNLLGLGADLGIEVPGGGLVAPVLMAAGFLGLLSASAVVVTRHTPGDGGGVIDAALIGVGAAGPLWEFVLRPRLAAAHAPAAVQLLALANLLALLATLGSMRRIARTMGTGSLRYLYVSIALGLAGVVASVLTADLPHPVATQVVPALWAVAYLSFGAAALHPAAVTLTEPVRRQPERPTLRLAHLGAVLSINPVVGGLPVLWGGKADAPLLSVGTLVVIGLVLARIGQLLRQRAEAESALAHRASHDELTGLLNRHGVLARLEESFGAGVGVLYCDLDRFKPINDTLGHLAGDEVLRQVAARLRAAVRPGGLVGRIGGDEFLIVCHGVDATRADALRRRLTAAVGAPMTVAGHRVDVGVTIGTALTGSGPALDRSGPTPDRRGTASGRAGAALVQAGTALDEAGVGAATAGSAPATAGAALATAGTALATAGTALATAGTALAGPGTAEQLVAEADRKMYDRKRRPVTV
ncbi:GGDEF domain-containing protein [Dactylosporangium sp. NPDC050588]|uniref:GGDEF domain-containing protein n=1 Tax=Dactylosporangium sp. NPDC050588 TaxID=3157211 RepID=UPI00340DACFB